MNPSRCLAGALALACLGACASPETFVGNGERFERHSDKAPEAAAYCVASNAGRTSWPLGTAQAQVHKRDTPGMYDVLHRTMAGEALSIALIEPEAGGSKITVWFRYSSSVAIGANFGARVAGDC